jgi:hypothetical protein
VDEEAVVIAAVVVGVVVVVAITPGVIATVPLYKTKGLLPLQMLQILWNTMLQPHPLRHSPPRPMNVVVGLVVVLDRGEMIDWKPQRQRHFTRCWGILATSPLFVRLTDTGPLNLLKPLT